MKIEISTASEVNDSSLQMRENDIMAIITNIDDDVHVVNEVLIGSARHVMAIINTLLMEKK